MGLPISLSAYAEHDLAIQYRWYLDHGGSEIAEAFMGNFVRENCETCVPWRWQGTTESI